MGPMALLSIYRAQRVFILGYASLLLLGGVVCLSNERMALFLQLNAWHQPWLDVFFKHITQVGSGKAYVLFFVLLAFSSIDLRRIVGGGVGFVLTYIINKLCKRVYLTHLLRPTFATTASLHLVPGVVYKANASFPSGHAIVSFSMVTFLVLLLQPRWYQSLALLLLACVLSYARVYLAQHCFHDVYGGALIGGLSTLFSYALLQVFPFFAEPLALPPLPALAWIWAKVKGEKAALKG